MPAHRALLLVPVRAADPRGLLLAPTGLALLAGLVLALAAPSGAVPPHQIEILSSAPDQVSGGDALVRVQFPGVGIPHNATLLLNGEDVSPVLAPAPGGSALLGVVEGFVVGENLLELKPSPSASVVLASLSVRNYPITGPIFSGPHQQPFVCTTARVGLGQPLVDNQDAIGIPVAEEDADGNYPSDGHGYTTADATIVGWSKNCSAERRFDYLYRTTGGNFAPYDPDGPPPADLATTTTLDGQTVPYIVRWERGTINRFIYSVAMLAPAGESDPQVPDDSYWSGRLLFGFQGGVAIGHHQGTTSNDAMLPDAVLRLGYAVLNSTGLGTNTHYNLELGGETALMLKEHFIEDHGVPLYTVGVGGSGGAVQQYVYAQNHPGLVDAGVPQYSYSDMVTQTIHMVDCELLEHYFDVTDKDNSKWRNVFNRRAVEGLNASNNPANMSDGEREQWNLLYGSIYWLLGLNPPLPPAPPGPAITECRRAWFGLAPLVLDPTFTDVDDLDKLAQGAEDVEWTHWGDLVNVYGTGETGFARVPWDNVGVQYGLQALKDGVITPAEFLDLNAQVGSWTETADMVEEGYPFVDLGDDTLNLLNFDPWSARNMNLSPDGGDTPAPRRSGDLQAIQAAYESGMRFDGHIDIPIIDWRHYLEEELDMHHSHQSFATRRRLELARGNHDNQVIWFTDARPFRSFDQTPEALAVIDEWMANLRAHPELGVAGNRPADAIDRCFATDGTEVARGDDVWDGILNDEPPGTCTQQFPSTRAAGSWPAGPSRAASSSAASSPCPPRSLTATTEAGCRTRRSRRAWRRSSRRASATGAFRTRAARHPEPCGWRGERPGRPGALGPRP
jgi:hypothetical protein